MFVALWLIKNYSIKLEIKVSQNEMPVSATRNSKLDVHTYNWVPLMSLNHHLNSELGFRVLARITDLSIK